MNTITPAVPLVNLKERRQIAQLRRRAAFLGLRIQKNRHKHRSGYFVNRVLPETAGALTVEGVAEFVRQKEKWLRMPIRTQQQLFELMDRTLKEGPDGIK